MDVGEKAVSRVKISLDGQTQMSNYTGEFRFNGVEPGGYDLSIDISSIPIEYLPRIKLKDTVFIKEGEGLEYLVPLKAK